MRTILILPLSTLLACGPLAPSLEATTTVASETADTTHASGAPTTPTAAPTSSSSDSSTQGATTSALATTDEIDFIIEPDGGGEGTIRCDVFKQDCPPGKKCAAWAEGGGGAWNATKCVDITGDDAPGEPCFTIGGGVSGMDGCAFGAMCWDVNVDNEGTCVPLCTGTPGDPMCPPHLACAFVGEVLNLCLPICDPRSQDCFMDERCIPSGDGFDCVPAAGDDAAQVNEPCELHEDCDNGLACIPTADASSACPQDSPGCCQPFCDFPDSDCPNPDQQCLQWFASLEFIPGWYEDIGICAIPE